MNTMTIKDLKIEFRITNCGDAWGTTLSWLFAIAEELYFNRDTEVPDSWNFQPSPFGITTDDDSYELNVVRECDDALLIKFGNILSRYANFLKRANKDY